MIKVGLTGGIGSGKSIICQVFSCLKIPIYYADAAAEDLMNNDRNIKNKLINLLGEDIYEENSLNKVRMASLIFNNKELLNQINKIVHPEVTSHFKQWCRNITATHYVIHESALIFESCNDHLFDFIITVSAPEEVRINRVISRKDMNRKKIMNIIQNQLPEEEKILHSNKVIINDDKTLIIPQILKIHQQLTQN